MNSWTSFTCCRGVYNHAKQYDKSEEELQWVLRFDVPAMPTANSDLACHGGRTRTRT